MNLYFLNLPSNSLGIETEKLESLSQMTFPAGLLAKNITGRIKEENYLD